MPAIYFSTTRTADTSTFRVGAERFMLVFKTGIAPRHIRFRVQNKLDALVVELSDNHLFLEVKLPAYSREKLTLHALKEGNSGEEPIFTYPQVGVTGWYFAVPTDGIWYLTILDEKGNVVAQQVALVNHQTLRQLTRYRKRINPALHEDFDRRCHYNGMVILFYECGQFRQANDMLTLLQDLA